VVLLRTNVKLLPAVGTMAVTDDSQLLQDVERAIHGGRDRRGIHGPAPLNELTARDVTVGRGEDIHEHPPLGGPAKAALAQSIADGVPGPGS